MSSFRQRLSTLKEKSWFSWTNLMLLVILVVAIVALYYAVNPKTTSNNATRSNFTVKDIRDTYEDLEGVHGETKPQRTSDESGDWWNTSSNSNKVVDGNDASNAMYPGAAQSQCPPKVVAEAYHPTLSAASGAPRMVSSAAAYSSAYPDETAAVSLAGKTTYSCAPDVTNSGGCDYALNPDNLLPGSWREGVGCSDGLDPNSQWAKYAPTRQRYYRYITAAGSARLGVSTRSPMKKILGIQNYLRSATSMPLSNTHATPFNGSSLRSQAIFDSLGQFPDDDRC